MRHSERERARSDAMIERASGDAGQRWILLVDDNEDSCTLLKMLLEMAGWEVSVAYDGATALALVDGEQTTVPAAALIDLGLPGMSGQELVAALRTRPSMSACLLVCLSGRDPSEIDWRAAGFDRFVRKPANFAELSALLEAEAASPSAV